MVHVCTYWAGFLSGTNLVARATGLKKKKNHGNMVGPAFLWGKKKHNLQ